MAVQPASLIRRIVCSVESTPSVSAELRLAIVLAGQFDATLDVLQIRDATEGIQLKYISFEDQAKRLMRSLDSYQKFDQIVQAAGESIRVATHSADGPALVAILKHAERKSSDLVILNSKYALNLSDHLPSNLGKTVGEINGCALLTVRCGEPPPVFDRILLPVDFSDVTRVALAWTVAFAQRFGSTVHLLHVIARSHRDPNSREEAGASHLPMQKVATMSAQLSEVEANLRQRGLRVSSAARVCDDPAEGIIEQYERGKHDLIVMGMTGTVHPRRRTHEGVISRVRQNEDVSLLSVGSAVPDVEFAFGDSGDEEEDAEQMSVNASSARYG